MFQTIDPTAGQPLREFQDHSHEDVEHRLEETFAAWREWSRFDPLERVPVMRELARLLEDQREDHARRIVREMGKPISQARNEIDKCARTCLHFAEHAPRMLAPQPESTDSEKSYVAFRPLGPVLGVMPWNFPYWQVFRFAVPTLMAGNAVLVKHAENVPACAQAIEQLFEEAGFPRRVVTNLRVHKDQVERVISDDRVAAVTLTGSLEAGKAVAQVAGQHLKKSVLELGGSDPYLILEDCDLEQTVKICVQSRMDNSGQSCIAAKRFIVMDAVRDEFEDKLAAAMSAQILGDPNHEATQVGPLAREDLRERLHEQVEKSVGDGARVLTGAKVPDGPGFYYPPTVLTDVRPGMPAFDEELFGPVAAVVPAQTQDEAVALANQSAYGLGAAVFTGDVTTGERLARDALEAGVVCVNDHVRSDPRLPFGGVKKSGYGRELSYFGLWEFMNIKSVNVMS